MRRFVALTMVFGLLLGMLPQPAVAQSSGGNTIFLPLVTSGPDRTLAVSAAAAAGDLFLSEYIEGSSNNKALEIFNGTGAPIDLAAGGYAIAMYSNANLTAGLTINLSGTIADGDVFVLAQSNANAAILAQADQTNGAGWFNGNDTVVLTKAGVVIDSLGKIAENVNWSANGVGTTNQTLRRKADICTGDIDPTDAFDPSLEWDGFPQDDSSDLGMHTSNCGGAEELFLSEYIEGSSNNKALEIFNGTGAPIDLAAGGYAIAMYSNANLTAGLTINLSGTIADGDVFVLAQSNANAAILAQADQTNGAGWFNGNDTVVLTKAGVVIDSLGKIAENVNWSANGVGTTNQTLRRKADICTGDIDPTDAFDPSLEWDGFPQDDSSDLGMHTSNCGSGGGGGGTAGLALPFAQGFDDCTLAGWTIFSIDSDTANTWSCSSAFSNIEANGYNDSAPANDWLITPALNLDAQDNDALTFRSYTQYTDSGIPYPQVTVLYSTDYAGGDPSAATWTTLSGITFSPVDSREWTGSGVVDISGISGESVSFAFQYQASGTGSGTTTVWRLDEVEFFESTGGPAVITPIHDIQGAGAASPLDGTVVSIEGVVVGDFQNNGEIDNGDLNGFFVQEQDTEIDTDPLTSEGIFVFDGGSSVDVKVGDVVQVTGEVDEYFDLTEVTNVSAVTVLDSGASVTAAELTLPVTSLDDFERVEGMWVTFPQALTISEYFNFDRFGEIVLTDGRQNQPTAVVEPGGAANALAAAQALSRITLDDGRTSQNPDPAIHPNGNEFTLTNTFRGGDLVENATGVLTYGFDLYRLHPTQGADVTAINPRTAAPDAVGGNIKVASFNVLNYFTTLNSRGANDANEFDRQRAKIIAALAALEADVVGLIEIENNTDAIVDLVTGLNNELGSTVYEFVDTGVIGTDEIKVAFIYKSETVSPVGSYAILDSSVNARFLDTKNRPALAQTFARSGSTAAVTVVVNHLKSKGSDCADVGDPDLGDGAGNCNLTRQAAAQALVDWLATDPTGSGDPDYLIIGDLNAYDEEDPIDAILAGADDTLGTSDDYTDLVFQFQGPEAYSYVFDGKIGYLDHALAGAALAPQVTGTTVWHINADEPDILDYDTSFKQDAQDALYEANAYRSSDHDPVVIGLDLNAPPVCSAAAPSIASLWPVNHKMVAVNVLGVTDPDGDAVSIVIDSIMQDELINGNGDGNTAFDGDGVGTDTAWVRAERDGGGNGRVYHIAFTATDSQGTTCSGALQVGVPKSTNKPAVDDGALYDSTQAVSGSSVGILPPEQNTRLYLPTMMR